jgi:hypothetical protein
MRTRRQKLQTLEFEPAQMFFVQNDFSLPVHHRQIAHDSVHWFPNPGTWFDLVLRKQGWKVGLMR